MAVVSDARYVVARKLPNGRYKVFGESFHLAFDSFDRASEIATLLIAEEKLETGRSNNPGKDDPENSWRVYVKGIDTYEPIKPD